MSLKIGFSLFILTLASASAHADNWSRSFDSSILAESFPARSKLAIVAAGEAAEPAAAALRQALEEVDKVELVIDQQALGGSADLGLLDDPHITARAAGLALDGVVIVRLYRGRHGRADSAFVVVYHGADRLASFSVVEGEPMSAPTVAPPPVSSAAQASYDRAHLSVSETFHFSLFASRHDLDFVEGSYQKPISGDAFFERVGRPDLARAYLSRQRTRKTLMAFGAIVLAAGVAGMATGITLSAREPGCSSYTSTHVCIAHDEPNSNALVGGVLGGIAGIGGGVGLLIGGGVMRAQPTSTGEARELADEYNGKLRHSLGLEALPGPADPRTIPIKWSLAPSLSPSSAGMSLALTY